MKLVQASIMKSIEVKTSQKKAIKMVKMRRGPYSMIGWWDRVVYPLLLKSPPHPSFIYCVQVPCQSVQKAFMVCNGMIFHPREISLNGELGNKSKPRPGVGK